MEAYNTYVGNQYSGKDPWGNEIIIKLNSFNEKKELDWTFTTIIEDGNSKSKLYNSVISVFKDGTTFLNIKGTSDNKKYSFDLMGTIILKDGNIVTTYESGDITGNNKELKVEKLEVAKRTFTLTK